MAMGARKKSAARKPAGKRPAGAKASARKPGKKPAARKKGGALRAPTRRPSPTEELAKRIVAAMNDEWNLDLGKFYTDDAVSEEPAGGTTAGLQSLRSKLAGWLAGLRSAQWRARNVLVSGKAICIEWEAEVVMKDGRSVKLKEVAVHEVRGDKIFAERYYYDPRGLMPPQQPARPEPARPAPRPRPMPAVRHSEGDDDDEGSGVDPMDL